MISKRTSWIFGHGKHASSKNPRVRFPTDVHARFKNGGVTDYLASQETAQNAIQLDYTRVLAEGDSAGGYLAIQSGLTQPRGTIRAILACYPMTNYLNRKQEPMFMGEPSPPESIIDVSTPNFLLHPSAFPPLYERTLQGGLECARSVARTMAPAPQRQPLVRSHHLPRSAA
jgi:acetyl esterase/lipase